MVVGLFQWCRLLTCNSWALYLCVVCCRPTAPTLGMRNMIVPIHISSSNYRYATFTSFGGIKLVLYHLDSQARAESRQEERNGNRMSAQTVTFPGNLFLCETSTQTGTVESSRKNKRDNKLVHTYLIALLRSLHPIFKHTKAGKRTDLTRHQSTVDG